MKYTRTASVIAGIGAAGAILAGCSTTATDSATTTVTAEAATTEATTVTSTQESSTSAEPKEIEIPSGLEGTNAQIAMEKLTEAGFTKVTPASVDEKASVPVMLANWTVVSVEPGAGEKVSSDSTVILKVQKDNN